MGNTAQLTEQNLANFYGSEQFYRHGLMRHVIYTEGVHFLEENGAAWLLDAVASHQMSPKVRQEPFQSWKLKVKGSSAVLEATDGNEKKIARQKIDYTDFPLDEINLYVCDNGQGVTVMLASEY